MSTPPKEPPPPPALRSETPVPEQVRDLILSLTKTISSIKIFSWEHASTQKMVHTFWEKFSRFLDKRTRLDIGIEGFAFTFRNQVIYHDDKAVKSLPFLLNKDGMRQLSFFKSLKEEELREFLKIIRDAFETPSDETDIVNQLWERDLANIRCYAPDNFLEAKIGGGKEPPMRYADPSELRMGVIDAPLKEEQAKAQAQARDIEAAMNLDFSAGEESPELSQTSPEEEAPQKEIGDGEAFSVLNEQEDRALRQMLQINRQLSPSGEMVLLVSEILRLEPNPGRFLEIMEVVGPLHLDLIQNEDFGWAAQLLILLRELKAGYGSPTSFQHEPLQTFLDNVKSRDSLSILKMILTEKRPADYRPLFEYLGLIGPEALPLVTDLCDILRNPAFYSAMDDYLKEIGRLSPSQLLQLASMSRPVLTKQIIAALSSHPDKRVVLLLAAFRGSWENSIKQDAILALGKSQELAALRILYDFLDDKDESIRVFAANSIRKLDDKALLEKLRGRILNQTFHQRSLVERQAYLDLVARHQTLEANGLLRDVLKKGPGLLHGKNRTASRLAVVQALRRAGGQPARELLEEGRRMRGRKVRKACRKVLERMLPEYGKTAKTPQKKT